MQTSVHGERLLAEAAVEALEERKLKLSVNPLIEGPELDDWFVTRVHLHVGRLAEAN